MSDSYFDRVEAHLAGLARDGAHLGASSRSRRWRGGQARLFSALGVAASVGAVGAVVVVALSADRHDAVSSTTPIRAASGPAPALVASFRLLRRPEQAGDRSAVGLGLGACVIRRSPGASRHTNPLMPHGSEHVVECGAGPTALQRRYGLENPASLPLRHLSIPTTRIQTWLIAGSRGACWNAVGPNSGRVIGERCFSAADVARRILVGTLPRIRASGFEIGLVTDTARSVALRRRNGTTKILPLASGYFYTTYQPGDEILADTSSGVRVIQSFGAKR